MLRETSTRSARLLKRSTRSIVLVALAVILWKFAFGDIRIEGDGNEYVMMAHGFSRHATPELRPSDIADIDAMPDRIVRKSNLLKDELATVAHRLQQNGGMPMGFASGHSWGIQAVHFWMYSLLATPFYALTAALGKNLALAFSLLNFVAVALTIGCVLRWYPRIGVAGAAFLATLGPAYYLHWTGPEVMCACCALLATLAIVRRDVALAVALAGLGATQNPSISGLILAAGASWGLLALRPAWASGAAPYTHPLRNALLVVTGIVLALLPYAYNQLVFGMPSIIAAYFTNLHLISFERIVSLFFDLDQGMVIGFPGLFLGLILVPVCLAQPLRLRWLVYAAAAFGLTAGLALPPLATVNWNSAHFVVLRYAYWTAMPLVAVCIVGLAALPARRRLVLLACIGLSQVTAMWALGWPYGNGHLSHSPLGNWTLNNYPASYNPDAEIFVERELHDERSPVPEQVFVHRGPDSVTKLMRYWANTADAGGVCPPGRALVSVGRIMRSGWEYFDAPFRCGPPARPGADWIVNAAHGEASTLLGEGWSRLEETGVWTDGVRSVLRVPLPAGVQWSRLAIAGTYLKAGTMTDVTINDVHLGRMRLASGPIALPASIRHAAALRIVLGHDGVAGPELLRTARDTRKLAFFLHYIHVE
jgi:hypothetical protein